MAVNGTTLQLCNRADVARGDAAAAPESRRRQRRRGLCTSPRCQSCPAAALCMQTRSRCRRRRPPTPGNDVAPAALAPSALAPAPPPAGSSPSRLSCPLPPPAAVGGAAAGAARSASRSARISRGPSDESSPGVGSAAPAGTDGDGVSRSPSRSVDACGPAAAAAVASSSVTTSSARLPALRRLVESRNALRQRRLRVAYHGKVKGATQWLRDARWY